MHSKFLILSILAVMFVSLASARPNLKIDQSDEDCDCDCEEVTTPNPTGTTPYPTDATSYPTGTTSYPTDTTSYPTGTTSYPTDTTSYPTGTTSYPTDTTSYPTGTTSNPEDTTSLSYAPSTWPAPPSTASSTPSASTTTESVFNPDRKKRSPQFPPGSGGGFGPQVGAGPNGNNVAPFPQFPGGFPGNQFPGNQFPGSQFPGGQFPGAGPSGGFVPGVVPGFPSGGAVIPPGYGQSGVGWGMPNGAGSVQFPNPGSNGMPAGNAGAVVDGSFRRIVRPPGIQ